MTRRRWDLEIFLISLAAIAFEIGLTRVFSFKLVYYFTYVILGIALLGLGSGGVIVSMLSNERREAAERTIPLYCLLAAVGVIVGYGVLAFLQVNAIDAVRAIPAGDTGVLLREGAKLTFLCFVIYLPFLGAGLAIATIFATNADRIHRLYFFDLLGAALGCATAVWLLNLITPPGTLMLAGALFAVAGLPAARQEGASLTAALGVAGVLLFGAAIMPGVLPDPIVDRLKTMGKPTKSHFSSWSPVFRIDVIEWPKTPSGAKVISHDGMWGALLRPFDGDASKLTHYQDNPRAYPFALYPNPNIAIIGAAGGNEIFASLHFDAEHVTGVELNPITVSLLEEHFYDWTGGVVDHEKVTLINDEGRSFFMKHDGQFDVVWFVTPDSYAAMNAASSGGQVLSESYLYTAEMLMEAIEHLTPDGIVTTQFGGELTMNKSPARTARYLATAREAFRRLGIEDFDKHVLVSSYDAYPFTGSSIVLKRSPINDTDIERFREVTLRLKGGAVRYTPEMPRSQHPIHEVIYGTPEELEPFYANYPYDVTPVSDDAPFFWHFVRFSDAVESTFSSPKSSHESGNGERLLLLLLVISSVLAAVLLFSPLLLRREVWKEMPSKGLASIYFAALGAGFMYLEVSLIQRLTLFLGYPTYSLTVTLFAILISTGIGSRLSENFGGPTGRLLARLAACLTALVCFYTFALTPIIQTLVGAPLAVRIGVTIALLMPLGLCLGVFMPLGLSKVSTLSSRGEEYVAWAWAINGFFSVLGSVSSTIVAMKTGFAAVMWIALAMYLVGMFALWRISPEAEAR